jgi:Pterin 4 alpha carbinolamine dehydratase
MPRHPTPITQEKSIANLLAGAVHHSKCRVEYWTHAIGGLSENDFICAAKVDVLFEL